jgi:hypothetical protein
MSDLRFPIGRFEFPATVSQSQRLAWIDEVAATPAQMRAAVAGLNDAQLATPYRDGGWTVNQVVHHVPESHMNAYVRFKLALTEDQPTIKPYDEARWAQTGEVQTTPIDISLTLLESLHDRWVRLLRTLTPGEWQLKFNHPESGVHTLEEYLALYAWHGKHHVAHVTALRRRMGW